MNLLSNKQSFTDVQSLIINKQLFPMFFKIGALKNFAKMTRKHFY